MRAAAFFKGLKAGLAAPFTAFQPGPVRTEIPQEVLEPSYRPLSEDALNIRQYFGKALGEVSQKAVMEKRTAQETSVPCAARSSNVNGERDQ